MKKIFVRSMKKIFFVAALFSLSACTNSIAYNYLPFWIDYYLSDYVDMNDAQEERLESDLKKFHQWHRQHELPQIKLFLQQAQKDFTSPLSQEMVITYDKKIKERLFVNVNALTPAISTLLVSLSDKQVNEWMLAVDEKIKEKQEEANEGSPSDQRERRLESMTERAEYWVDDISAAQKDKLTVLVSKQIAMRPVFYGVRDSLRDEFFELLKTRKSPDFQQRFKTYVRKSIYYSQTTPNEFINQYQVQQRKILAEFNQSLTNKQRQNMDEKFVDLQDDVVDLMK